jgi:hypothetical protein
MGGERRMDTYTLTKKGDLWELWSLEEKEPIMLFESKEEGIDFITYQMKVLGGTFKVITNDGNLEELRVYPKKDSRKSKG